MTNLLAEHSPSTRGRVWAVIYLFVIGTGILGQAVIADSLIVSQDAAKSAANILANKDLYRLAYTIFMFEMVAQVALSAMTYDLLKPVNKSLARVSAVLGITGSGIKTFARAFFYMPLVILGGASWLETFTPAQLETLAYLSIRINSAGASIGLVFFGFETLTRGWLIYRSGFMPRILGVISMIGGIGWITWVWPPLGSKTFIFVALTAIIGVIATSAWLLIRGIDNTKWKERAALAESSIWR